MVKMEPNIFSIEGQSYPLEFNRRKMHVDVTNPTQDDYDNVLTNEMTSPCPLNPDVKTCTSKQ